MGIINRDEVIRSLAMSLRQVGRAQIGRILGTTLPTNGAYKALLDLLERCYFMRAELNVVARVLIDKKIIDKAEWEKRIEDEFRLYLSEVAREWPEMEFTASGYVIKDTKALAERSRREGWPP